MRKLSQVHYQSQASIDGCTTMAGGNLPIYLCFLHTHTRVQRKKKLKLWRKEKVYNKKKRKENAEANRTQQSARQKQLQLQVAASVGDINNGDNDGTRRNPEKMYKSRGNKEGEEREKSPSRNNRRGRGCPERIQPLYLRAGAGARDRVVKGSRVANV